MGVSSLVACLFFIVASGDTSARATISLPEVAMVADPCPDMPSSAGQKVIINTDPGIDDSMAILLALSAPELVVMAITVNFGSLHNTSILTRNALTVLELAGRQDIPVYVGASDPLNGDFHDLGGPLFHGQNGLGNVAFPEPTIHANTSITAAEYIVEACRAFPAEITIISLSPPTNLALALQLEPKLPTLARSVSLMGGTVLAAGNVSPVAEANLANDAGASRIVFEAGFDLTMAGLDVTMATHLTADYLESLEPINKAGAFIHSITQFYLAAYAGIGFPYMPVHDPTAVMVLLEPGLYKSVLLNVVVHETAYPDVVNGYVVADRRAGPDSPPPPPDVLLTKVLMEVDSAGFGKAFKSRISTLP